MTVATTLGTLSAVTDNGNGTYRVTLVSRTAGTATITGTVNGTPIVDDAVVVFTPGVAVALTFTVEPSDPIAEATIDPPVRVEAVDANGNRVTGFNKSVALVIVANPSGATLVGTTMVTAIDGVATFSGLSIDREGTGYTLQATSGTLTPAVTAPFNVLSNKVDLDVRMAVSDGRPAPHVLTQEVLRWLP